MKINLCKKLHGSFRRCTFGLSLTNKEKKMRITANTIREKIKNISGVSVKMVSSDGGGHFTVYLNSENENFKVAYAIHRAGYARTANNGKTICLQA
jgi:hypothetical protein